MSQDDPQSSAENPYADGISVNPYQASSETTGQAPLGDAGQAKDSIREMARWQTVFTILLGLGFGLMVLIFVGQIAMSGGAGLVELAGGALCFGVVGLLFNGLPGILLWQASRAAKRFANSDDDSFAEFARSQNVFWRAIGILAIIAVVGYGLIIVVALVGVVG